MITTSSNLQDAITFVTTEADSQVNTLSNIMSSSDTNDIMIFIEESLGNLYEKSRTLEDIRDYTMDFLTKAIADKRRQIEAQLKTIETNADSYLHKGFVAYSVPFEESNDALKDRDGTVLPASNVFNARLIMNGETAEEITINSASKKSYYPCYRDGIDGISEGKAYRSYYLLDNTVYDGLLEDITIYFEETTEINYFGLLPVNAQIKSISFINESDAEVPVEDINNVYQPKQLAKGVKITLCATNYNQEDYQIDASRITDDAWNTIKDNDYQQTLTGNTIADVEEATGIAQYQRDYNTYLQAMSQWQAENERVNSRNLALQTKNEVD